MTILREVSTMWASCFSFVMFLILFESRLPMRRTVFLSLFIMGPLLAANFILLFLLGPETMSTAHLQSAQPGVFLVSGQASGRTVLFHLLYVRHLDAAGHTQYVDPRFLPG